MKFDAYFQYKYIYLVQLLCFRHTTYSAKIEYNSTRFSSATPGKRQKPKIDAKFIADPELWDPATPREEKTPVRRTRSAHVRTQSAQNR